MRSTTTMIFLIFLGGVQAQTLLSGVEHLTMVNGQMTTGNRSSPVPQIKCVGGSTGCLDVPVTMECKNIGYDGKDVMWECTGDLDVGYKFGRTDVFCEGYEFPDDDHILNGSCGVEYTLEVKTPYVRKKGSLLILVGFSILFMMCFPRDIRPGSVGGILLGAAVASSYRRSSYGRSSYGRYRSSGIGGTKRR